MLRPDKSLIIRPNQTKTRAQLDSSLILWDAAGFFLKKSLISFTFVLLLAASLLLFHVFLLLFFLLLSWIILQADITEWWTPQQIRTWRTSAIHSFGAHTVVHLLFIPPNKRLPAAISSSLFDRNSLGSWLIYVIMFRAEGWILPCSSSHVEHQLVDMKVYYTQ